MNDESGDEWRFKPAKFVADLQLPCGDDQQLLDAAAAVRQEFRDSSRWKRLNCRRVSVFAERDRGAVYVVHIGKTVEFDWTWEGARAFCPNSLDGDGFSDRFYEDADNEDEAVWSGEIVEVDGRNGCLFVVLDDPEAVPRVGAFFVRPFEFLSVLDAIYSGGEFGEVRKRLPARLNASKGGFHPDITFSCGRSLSPGSMVAAHLEHSLGTTGDWQDLDDGPADRPGFERLRGTCPRCIHDEQGDGCSRVVTG